MDGQAIYSSAMLRSVTPHRIAISRQWIHTATLPVRLAVAQLSRQHIVVLVRRSLSRRRQISSLTFPLPLQQGGTFNYRGGALWAVRILSKPPQILLIGFKSVTYT